MAGVHAVALTGVAQMMLVGHHEVGATAVVGARDSAACANGLQHPGAATRHAGGIWFAGAAGGSPPFVVLVGMELNFGFPKGNRVEHLLATFFP